MESIQRQVGKYLWLQWVGVSVLGFVLAIPSVLIARIIFGESSPAYNLIGRSAQFLPLFFLQWLILRRYILEKGWWILASMIGISLGFLSYRILYMPIIFGIFLGTAQWLVLRRHITTKHDLAKLSINKVHYWVAISLFAWIIPTPISDALMEQLSEPFGAFVGWVINDALKGFAIVWMLEPPELDEINGDTSQTFS